MRTLSTPVVLSSMVLAGWLTQAAAQDVRPWTPAAPAPAASGQVDPGNQADAGKPAADEDGSGDLPPGVVRQPSLEAPGLVTGITVGELYTDNLRLSRGDEPRQTGWITVVQPFVKAAHAGPRFSGVMDLSLAGYLYAGHGSYNQVAGNLRASGTLTLLPQHLFLDGSATYGRQVIDNRRPSGSGQFFLANNRANVATGTLSPYWIQDLGRVGTMTLRYTRGRVVYNRAGISEKSGDPLAGISNVTSDGELFRIVSPESATWGWELAYASQRLKLDDGRTFKFATAKLGLSRQLGMHVRVLADVGKENRYLPDGSVDELGATFWDAGLSWSDVRNTFKLLGGHRFYGRSASLSWTHQAARLTTRVGYQERPTDLNRQLLGQGDGAWLAVPRGFSRIPSLQERRIYLMKRASASATYQMPSGSLRLGLYHEKRDYFLHGSDDETVSNARLSWLFELGPFTSLTPSFGWRRHEFEDGQVNQGHYVQLEMAHQFDPANFISLRLRHGTRDTHDAAPGSHGYRVNVVFLSWTHLFTGS